MPRKKKKITKRSSDNIKNIKNVEKIERKRKIPNSDEQISKKTKKVKKSKENITIPDKIHLGAHVSRAGGVQNAIFNALEIGASAFQMDLKSKRKWIGKPIPQEDAIEFIKLCEQNNFFPETVIAHGSYLMNLGSCNPETLKKSRDCFVTELNMCSQLNIINYVFHPGSAVGHSAKEDCLDIIAESLNQAFEMTPSINVKAVLENSAGQGHSVCSDLSDIKYIIKKVEKKYLHRVGVCIDTCHAYAAGYDITNEEKISAFLQELNYLCCVHVNDSKGSLGCRVDRHENIGKGYLKKSFKDILKSFHQFPLILETPGGDYKREIEYLKKILN